ncbi:MAG: hypothetical protein M1281_15075 [Chloroflexi bacterium]|nr:hypothetical protein [Chloroflexota bacterium]
MVKVTGESMNLEGIDDGDYVLLHKQETADPKDIVAAEVIGTDTCATLKHFMRRDGKIILQPRSSHPKHKPFEFSEKDQGFAIRGVAIAVLKPA